MEGPAQEQAEASIAVEFGIKRGKKKQDVTGKRKAVGTKKVIEPSVAIEKPIGLLEYKKDDTSPEVKVSSFDFSVENYFKVIDTMAKLCGEADNGDGGVEESEIQRLSSSITFLKEWNYYNYEPKTVKFACNVESPEGKDAVREVKLDQFSSATVPKKDAFSGGTTASELSRDFVMYVGGPIWALDWCPLVRENTECSTSCEFIAVAAHPPGSSYHKMGAPVTGRGVIQIWCLLNVGVNDEDAPSKIEKPVGRRKGNSDSSDKLALPKGPRGRPRKKQVEESLDNLDSDKLALPKRPRGRPRKKQVEESLHILDSHKSTLPKRPTKKRVEESLDSLDSDKLALPRRPRKNQAEESLECLDSDSQHVQALAVQYPIDSSKVSTIDDGPHDTDEPSIQESCHKKRRKSVGIPASNPELENPLRRRRIKGKGRAKSCSDNASLLLLTQMEHQTHHNSGGDIVVYNNVTTNDSSEVSSTDGSFPADVALPRIVLCLAHNGKVAWDVKWRPQLSDACATKKHRLGYLAVLLGNGSLEVWEVPLPRTMKLVYSSLYGKDTNPLMDPRFVKLEPVFKCSILKCGGIQSIPLTLEWSSSPPHDYLLAGCNDGTVALWKFSASTPCKDTRPLLHFSADTSPIRGVAFAPYESDPESANVIVTAGHGGVKFWDLRDLFRPLWDIHPTQLIYSLDWTESRCILLAFDDGTIRLLGLLEAAYDGPVTGKPFTGTKQQGLHTYLCSSYAIWNVQISKPTGMVAYCTADGSVIRFQLTTKQVEKFSARNRTPHFLCGSFNEENSTITINSPVSDTPFPLKKASDKCGNNSAFMREAWAESNRAKGGKIKSGNDPTLEGETLAICDVEDPIIESGSEDTTMLSLEEKKTPKSRSNKKKAEDNGAKLCLDIEPIDTEGKESEKVEEGERFEVLPSKTVAVHKVRWNMNKGSERWLCFGGAAGVLRCQEIVLSQTDKKLMIKR